MRAQNVLIKLLFSFNGQLMKFKCQKYQNTYRSQATIHCFGRTIANNPTRYEFNDFGSNASLLPRIILFEIMTVKLLDSQQL